MTAESLSLISAAVLSLLFSYVPGLNSWFGGLDGLYKRLIMLVLLVAVAGVSYGTACAGWGGDFGVALSCDKAGAVGLVKALVLAIMANQSTYAISPK